MKRLLYWLYLLVKRQLKNPVIVVVLIAMPVAALIITNTASLKETEPVRVGIVLEDDDKIAIMTRDYLVNGNYSVQFYEAESQEKLEQDIMNKYTECGYVVGTGLKDKLDSGSYRDIIELIICRSDFVSSMTDEIFFSAMFKAYSPEVAVNYVDSVDIFKKHSEKAEYEIIKGLKAKALFGYYFASELLNNQEYTYRVYRYDEATDEYVDVGGRASAWRERTNAYVEELTSNIQLAYEKAFGAHSINAVIGFEAIKRDTPKSWLHAIPASNSLHLIYYDTIDKYEDTGNNTEARLGWLGRFNYNYANKYLIDFSARYDGSWKFPPNHRWGFFPSASLGWRISEENFWKESKIASIFSDLKIRGSYGLVGDDNVDGYSAFDYMTGYDYKQGGGVIDGSYIIGTTPRNLPVTTLSWAKAKILDIGLDVAFLNNRLSGSVDFFRRIKTGIPASRDDVLLPEEVGFERPKENLNSNVHTGYDLLARWSDKVNDFHYSISANFTYSRFYNWEQYNPKFSNSWDEYRNSTWHRFGNVNWAYEADGQFQSWEEIASWPIDNDQKGNTTLRPGDIKYVDQNGDGIINDMDKRPIGYKEDSTPVLNFGFNLAFAWKGFDLALDFSGAGMSTWNPSLIQKIPFNNNGNNPAYYMEDTWRLSDIFDANSEMIPGKYPTLLIGNNANNHSNYWDSSFWKYNVRYLKLRNLEFGYTFPKEWLQKCRINSLRLYLAGQNLFTLTNVPIDPEVSAGNGTAYPSMRIINLGLTLKF